MMFKRLKEMEREQMDIKEKYQAFYPRPYVVCEEKTVECHTDHISLANHCLKSRLISHEQRLKLRRQQIMNTFYFLTCETKILQRQLSIRLTLHSSACMSVCPPTVQLMFCNSQKSNKKTVQCIWWEKYFWLLWQWKQIKRDTNFGYVQSVFE